MARTLTVVASFVWLAFGLARAQEVQPANAPGAMNMTPEEAKRKYEESLAAMPPELQKMFRDLEKQRQEAPVRPRLTRLDEATLRAIPPAELDDSIVDYVYDRLDGKIGEAAPLSSLPHGLQVFFVSYVVEAEVTNGGFNQFFLNSSSEYATQVPDALRELDAPDAAAIFEQAQVVAATEESMRARLKEKGSLEAFSQSYKQTHLGQFDAPFCKFAEGFPALRAELVKRHPGLFTS